MSEKKLISLHGLEMIMTYRGSTQERRENLRGVLRHLNLTYSDYTLYLMEADATPTFHWSGLGDEKIRHVFVHDDGPFPKAKLCNLGARLCTGEVICFHDADKIANPEYLPLCIHAIKNGVSSDALCPFLRVFNVTNALRKDFIDAGNYALFEPYLETALPEAMEMLYENTPGAIVLIKRADYVRVGGYDPRYTGWGGEDDDFLSRAIRLGVRWHSIQEPRAALFHLHHDSTSRRDALIAAERNRQAAAETRDMPLPKLEARAAELAKYFA
ncbi:MULTISPECIES: galactosyltransferase-related protein [unclassified Caballeronia]|uniref:galactosyltransferase-related protein n=1 Tax=unclassified Caballeronia TaxID=2646786 RepID=UPI0028645767|nr:MULTISPECIES: galactosyltransferase-related protein [unclassified Caballeronia]MDR5737416.1 galactosyltransferase-related protein [Caballeronia sp. LZ016]MDR5810055.1 galactosyltransferase-related protein [Caballeronia sp. LZ019]